MGVKIAYFRIIGNDLPPRHQEGQSLDNLRYQIAHEPEFDDVDKFWVVNRVVDNDARAAIKEELKDRSSYEIDINRDVYGALKGFKDKYDYLTNVNAARNMCLDLGFRMGYDIVLPFDGNCFFTLEGWQYCRNDMLNNFNSPYFLVPMARCTSYDDLSKQPMLKEMYTFYSGNRGVKRHDMTEPQIAFGIDHDMRFNENFRYSEASKVELLWKLQVPGIWNYWYPDLQREAQNNLSIHASRNPIYAGYVYRLPSGNAQAETDNIVRGSTRERGLRNLVEKADALLI